MTNDINFRYIAMNFQITNWLATSLGLPLIPMLDMMSNQRIDNEDVTFYTVTMVKDHFREHILELPLNRLKIFHWVQM